MLMTNATTTITHKDCVKYRAELERCQREADLLRAMIARLLDHMPDDLTLADEARRLLQ